MLLKYYENLLDIVTRMLDQARKNEWECAMELGKDYVDMVKQIQALAPSYPNESEAMAQQVLLTEITQKDAQIRELAQPELRRLGVLLGDTKRHKEVVQAYRVPSLNS